MHCTDEADFAPIALSAQPRQHQPVQPCRKRGRVFRQFANRLIGLAHAHLDTALRQKVGPEDVAQSVFRSFFRRQADQPYDLESWDGLWSLLSEK